MFFLFIHSTGEALDIYDILKLTRNGVLEENSETEKDDKSQKGEILRCSK